MRRRMREEREHGHGALLVGEQCGLIYCSSGKKITANGLTNKRSNGSSYRRECEVFKDILVKQRINYAIWILVYVLCCI